MSSVSRKSQVAPPPPPPAPKSLMEAGDEVLRKVQTIYMLWKISNPLLSNRALIHVKKNLPESMDALSFRHSSFVQVHIHLLDPEISCILLALHGP